MVEFEESSALSLLDFIGLESYLGLILGVNVDLVEKQTLKPGIGKHVLEEVDGVWKKSFWITLKRSLKLWIMLRVL